MWAYCRIVTIFIFWVAASPDVVVAPTSAPRGPPSSGGCPCPQDRLDWNQVQCIRHYDVNGEAIKLFGEDLASVLKRFRRSPEYWDIMQDRVKELKSCLDDTMTQVTYTYKTQLLYERVNDTLTNEFREDKKDKPNLRSVASLDEVFPAHLFQRQGEENGDNSTTQSPVEILDDHEQLHSPFSVSERNILRDVGFQVAQIAIQKIIESVGPPEDESEMKSTRMPNDDKKDTHHTTPQPEQETPTSPPALRAHSKPPHEVKLAKSKGKQKH